MAVSLIINSVQSFEARDVIGCLVTKSDNECYPISICNNGNKVSFPKVINGSKVTARVFLESEEIESQLGDPMVEFHFGELPFIHPFGN